MNNLLDTLPIHFIATGFLLGMFVIAEVGGLRRRWRNPGTDTVYAASAIVSLLALMISFTFSVALNRYDNRRELVVEESAAINMAWQRSRLVGEPIRSSIEKKLERYVDQRLIYFQQDRLTDRRRASDTTGRTIRAEMWDDADRLGAANVQPLLARGLIDALTRIDDAAARRESVAREHIPLLVIDLLMLFSLIAAGVLGYASAMNNSVNRAANSAFFVLVTLSITLVLDLDRPRTGMVIVSQLPMQELNTLMDAPPVPPTGNPGDAAAPGS